MAERPDSIDEMHEQDWLLVIEALMHYASPVDPQSGEVRGIDLEDPRKGLAIELAGFFADRIDIPEGSITAHIDPEWDGSER